MSEWQEVKLRECISTLKGFAFKSKWYQPDGVPIVRVSDFTDNSISVDDIEYIPHDLAQEHSRYLLKTKDVIIQTVGSWQHNPASIVGKVVNVPFNLNGALLNQNAVKIIPNKTIDNNFLYYRLKDEHFKLHNLGCAQGAANQASITLSSIGAFKFNLPPLPTQRKIAKILSNYDDLIENNLKRIKLLEESARLTYEEWFLRFRIDGKKLEIDPETKLPFGWEKVSLSETGEFLNGYAFKPKDLLEEGLPIIKIKEMKSGVVSDTPRNSGYELDNKYLISRGDILFSWSATLEVILWQYENGWLNQHLFKVSPNSYFPKSFLYLSLRDSLQVFDYLTTGATMKHIKRKELDFVKIPTPSNDILLKFDSLVGPMLREVLNLSHQNQLLKEARDILLPRLMTGMIDTDDMDIAV